jgi:uncharacterized membrane protein
MSEEPKALASPDRLNSFSDCVISILITIMLLNLRTPVGSGWAALRPLWPSFGAYALSFLFVGVSWFNHRHLMAFASYCSPSIIWTTLFFLFTMSFLPFSTAYLAAERMSSFSVMVYAITFMPMIASFMAIETCLAYGHSANRAYKAGYHSVMVRGAIALLIFSVAILISYASARWAFGLILFNTVLYVLPEKVRLFGRELDRRPADRAADRGDGPSDVR